MGPQPKDTVTLRENDFIEVIASSGKGTGVRQATFPLRSASPGVLSLPSPSPASTPDNRSLPGAGVVITLKFSDKDYVDGDFFFFLLFFSFFLLCFVAEITEEIQRGGDIKPKLCELCLRQVLLMG